MFILFAEGCAQNEVSNRNSSRFFLLRNFFISWWTLLRNSYDVCSLYVVISCSYKIPGVSITRELALPSRKSIRNTKKSGNFPVFSSLGSPFAGIEGCAIIFTGTIFPNSRTVGHLIYLVTRISCVKNFLNLSDSYQLPGGQHTGYSFMIANNFRNIPQNSKLTTGARKFVATRV